MEQGADGARPKRAAKIGQTERITAPTANSESIGLLEQPGRTESSPSGFRQPLLGLCLIRRQPGQVDRFRPPAFGSDFPIKGSIQNGVGQADRNGAAEPAQFNPPSGFDGHGFRLSRLRGTGAASLRLHLPGNSCYCRGARLRQRGAPAIDVDHDKGVRTALRPQLIAMLNGIRFTGEPP